MNDSIQAGFLIGISVVFVWASIDYNRFIKLGMVKPAPYGRLVTVIFRVFFLACSVGGIWQALERAIHSRRPAMFYLSALAYALGCIAIFFLMINLVERRHQKRIAR